MGEFHVIFHSSEAQTGTLHRSVACNPADKKAVLKYYQVLDTFMYFLNLTWKLTWWRGCWIYWGDIWWCWPTIPSQVFPLFDPFFHLHIWSQPTTIGSKSTTSLICVCHTTPNNTKARSSLEAQSIHVHCAEWASRTFKHLLNAF